MVRLRVCPCFRLSGYEEFMEPVANRPWDAWHVIDDGRWKKIYHQLRKRRLLQFFEASAPQPYVPKVSGHQSLYVSHVVISVI
jgi:hypothetical protein